MKFFDTYPLPFNRTSLEWKLYQLEISENFACLLLIAPVWNGNVAGFVFNEHGCNF